jgi:ribonuclease HI
MIFLQNGCWFFPAAKIRYFEDMAVKKKYYVVWAGVQPGLYGTWAECKEQVDHYEGAKYKSFETEQEAREALDMGYEAYYKAHPAKSAKIPVVLHDGDPKPILNSLSVDAAWNTATRQMEYRGVYTATRKEWFHKGPFPNASNNIGEFLALVHGIAFCKKHQLDIPIYTDSITALAWVRQKKHKSIILPTEENAVLFDLLVRAENWLKNNTYTNPIYKWNTPLWGEIPADFGRK